MKTILHLRLAPLGKLLIHAACFLFGVFVPKSGPAQCLPAASCQPGNAPAANLGFGMGIYRVTLAGLDTVTNGAADGYQDYSCRARAAQLVRGGSYTLTVRTNANADETVRAWLDLNHDGQFATTELVLSSTGRQHAAGFTVPATAVTGVGLRLRIAADYSNAPVPTSCSTPQYSQTEDYRVLVLATAPPRPQARFAALDTVSCGGAISFRDQSLNAPTQWLWRFGDGTTSTQQHPQHSYTAPGTYTVQLRACNAASCDSLTRTSYVTVRADAPRAASCTPATTAYCCGYGLTRVRLAGLDHRSADGQAGYEDFSCAWRATLTADRPATLQLTTAAVAHDVRLYVDLNDDGQFSAPAELLYQGLAVQSPTITLTIPTATPGLVYNRPLRLRLVADFAGSAATGPCSSPQLGQVEDYSVVLLPNAAPPAAAFTITYQRLCGPVEVSLRNRTTGMATRYHWDFGDGTSSTAAIPPVHTYAIPGSYTLCLVASNAYGTDSICQTVSVALNCPTYCSAQGDGGSPSSPAYFTKVSIDTLVNAVPRTTGIGYHDFTHLVIPLQIGRAYILQTESPAWTFAGNGPWVRVTAWMDYNQDGTFTSNERLNQISSFSPHRLTFQVSARARLGASRIRVQITSLSQPSDPSDSCPPPYQTASTEDYTAILLPAQQRPRAGFTVGITPSCSGLIQFQDTSWFSPTQWRWNFGDGTSSTAQAPQHAYSQPGVYTVSLWVNNQAGADSVSRQNAVVVNTLGQGPRPAACIPPSGPALMWNGIGAQSLGIGSWLYLNMPPTQNLPYRDLSCLQPVLRLTSGVATLLEFNGLTNFPLQLLVWLDSDGDGSFDPVTELVYSSWATPSTSFPKRGTITAPLTAVLNHPLRMRVWWMADYAPPAVNAGPCYRNENSGQVRDFTTIVVPAVTAMNLIVEQTPTLNLYPNPTTGALTIENSDQSIASTNATFYDAWGRIVLTLPVRFSDHKASLSVLPLTAGLYSLRLTGFSSFYRIVKLP